ALLPLPAGSISLDELQRVNKLLIKSGATINEINAVRKHISDIKGGQLAMAFQPALVISLILSDVVGDDLSTIASGITVPDPTTYHDAMDVLKKYGLVDRVPKTVRTRMEDGLKGSIPETPKEGDPCFQNVHNIIVGSAKMVADLITSRVVGSSAAGGNLTSHVVSNFLEGEAVNIGECFNQLIQSLFSREDSIQFSGTGTFFDNKEISLKYSSSSVKGSLLIFTGESTVTIKGDGIGGRNQEILLSVLSNQEIHGSIGQSAGQFAMAGYGMDGIEGNSPAAGAIIDSMSLEKAMNRGLYPRDYLKKNDSYHFFNKLGDVIETGPTGTNVNDVVILLVDVGIDKILMDDLHE
ncbi:MAG: glycerate kinase type-2 family protein, partial [Promethearchaeota archaeon]